jgi:hypothetical protein
MAVTGAPPVGERRFTDWLPQVARWLGRRYLSEVDRHFAPAHRA